MSERVTGREEYVETTVRVLRRACAFSIRLKTVLFHENIVILFVFFFSMF